MRTKSYHGDFDDFDCFVLGYALTLLVKILVGHVRDCRIARAAGTA